MTQISGLTRAILFATYSILVAVFIASLASLMRTLASPPRLTMNVQSRMAANYGRGQESRRMGALHASIFLDALRDQGLGADEARETQKAIERQLLTPVPTATARNFEGDPPFTATATLTSTPTVTTTSTNTLTPTNTPVPTWTPSVTPSKPPPKPTKKPMTPTITPTPSDTPTPTSSPTPIPDIEDPEVVLKGLQGVPSGAKCEMIVDFDVTDNAPSAGVSDSNVKLKYEYPKGSGNIQFASLSGGGAWLSGPGSTWAGSYSGTVKNLTPATEIKVWVLVTDNAGYSITALGIVLIIEASCNILEK